MPFRRSPFAKRTSRSSGDLFASEETMPKDVDPQDSLVAYIDGGARGNPGPAGYGVYMTDGNGKLVAELSEYLGKQTNNFAEYSGLVAALEYALQNEFDALKVVSDSELLVKQIRGEYKVKSESLAPIYAEAKELIRKLGTFSIRHVLREQNREADRLANLAMDRATGRGPAGPPKAQQPSAPALREVDGVVRDGVVEFTGPDLPNGTRVKIRPVR